MGTPSLIPQRLLQTPFVDPKTGILTSFAVTNFISRLLTPAKIPQLLLQTHAQRLATSAGKYPGGSLVFETDRSVYYLAQSNSWVYAFGIMQVVQLTLPGDLGAADTGFLALVADFMHLLQWTGQNWAWGPAEDGSGYISPFVNPPNPGTGWHACDGSANVPTLNPDGSTTPVNIPNTPGSFYRQ